MSNESIILNPDLERQLAGEIKTPGVLAQIRQRISAVRCVEHGRPVYLAFSDRGSDVGVNITGCCQEAVERAKAELQ
jgi:hypothetical protein